MNRIQKILIFLSMAALLYAGAALFNLAPDFLWFASFGFGHLWTHVLVQKLGVGILGFGLAFFWLGLNVFLARRISLASSFISPDFPPRFRIFAELWRRAQQQPTWREAMAVSNRLYNILLAAGVLVAALFFAALAKGNWLTILRFIHQTSAGIQDPIFKSDISRYLFTLPFLEFLQGWATLLLLVTLASVIWIYLTSRLFWLIFATNPPSRWLKPHLFSIIALIFLVIASSQWIKIAKLAFADNGSFYGGGYTDMHVRIVAMILVGGLLVLQAILTIIWGFRRGILIPVYTLLGILAIGFTVGTFFPGIVQQIKVTPNGFLMEAPFIAQNIAATRAAFQLDNISEASFPATTDLTSADINRNRQTLDNIRLWNRGPLKQTFAQLQEIRLYYEFLNVDVDRYMINGKMQQVMLSAREMDTEQLAAQAQTWMNLHLVYTHGYGVCMSPVNQVTSEGLPNFLIKDIPPVSSQFKITRPEIYFGEKQRPYVLVNSGQGEFDYPKGDSNAFAHYAGKGGIVLDSFWKRALYAIKFSDINLMISNLIKPDTRVMYDTQIRGIVEKLAPFLAYDDDPYVVVSKAGRLVWIIDAYTYTNRYPYSEPLNQIPEARAAFGPDSPAEIWNSNANYVRNAVKITIDAYSGETRFYIAEAKDPLIQTDAKIFPGMFKPLAEMPADLREHVRYPKWWFVAQSCMFSRYHMTNPQVFYSKEDVWRPATNKGTDGDTQLDAYHIVTKLPGDKEASFLLMMPFTPGNKSNMISWLSVKSDPNDYGQLKVYKFDKERTVYGPSQIDSRIDQDTEISQKLTLWGQVGSRVIRGDVTAIPVEKSLLYVVPIYLQATSSKFPELKRVIVAYGDRIEMGATLDGALSQILGNSVPTSSQENEQVRTETKSGKPTVLIDRVVQAFNAMKRDAANANWNGFGQKLEALDQAVQKLEKQK